MRNLPLKPLPMPEMAGREPLPEGLTRYTGFLVAKAHQNLFNHFSKQCQSLRMEAPHVGILHLLVEHGPMSQQQLGRQLRIDRTTMVKLIDGLELQKFAKRTNHPEDRRAYLVEIMASGRRALNSLQKVAGEMEKNLLANFTDQEVQVVRRALLTLAG